MSNAIASAFLVLALALPTISGCDKKEDAAPAGAAETGPAAPDVPAAPEPVTVSVDGTQTDTQSASATPAGATPAAPAIKASVGVSGVEASAGDVSVKLPN